MMDAPYTVLVSGVATTTSITFIKSARRFSNRNYRIIGVDIRERPEVAGARWCDAFYTVPSYRSDAQIYVDTLISIAQSEKVQAIIATLDHELPVLAKAAATFKNAGISLCIPRLEVIERANDKYASSEFLKSQGVPVVPSWLPEKRDTQLPFPLFIKPRDGVSNQHAHVVHTPQELDILLPRVPDPIIEEYIVGDHYNIDTLNDAQGRNLVAIPRKDVALATGLSTKAQVVADPELVAFGASVAEKCGIVGAANVEVFVRDGQIFFSEINPRLSAGCVLSIVAGVNIPELHLDVFTHQPISADKLQWRPGYYMTRYWEEVYSYNGEYV